MNFSQISSSEFVIINSSEEKDENKSDDIFVYTFSLQKPIISKEDDGSWYMSFKTTKEPSKLEFSFFNTDKKCNAIVTIIGTDNTGKNLLRLRKIIPRGETILFPGSSKIVPGNSLVQVITHWIDSIENSSEKDSWGGARGSALIATIGSIGLFGVSTFLSKKSPYGIK